MKDIKCSFCGKVGKADLFNKYQHPDGWMDIKNAGWTTLYACDRCARFVAMMAYIGTSERDDRTREFLEPWFPDFHQIEGDNNETHQLRNEITEYDINKYLKDLKVYCRDQNSCEICPIAYFEEKPEYYHCSLTNTPVFAWQDIADKLPTEHKILAEHIKMIANYCKDDMRNCEDCRYCRSYERCDLQLHIPADWVIYYDNDKRGEDIK